MAIIGNNISSLEKINFVGGETTEDTKYYRLVEHLLSLDVLDKKTLIRIVTSANYNDDKFIRSLEQLRDKGFRIRIVVSMDAVYKEQEFLRAGVNWDKFEKNTLELISAGFCRDINIVVSSINIGMISAIPIWLESKNLLDTIKPTLLFAQDKFSLSVLGGMGLYLTSTWKDEYKEHPQWQDPILAINRYIRKNRFLTPDMEVLDRLANFIQWYATANKIEIPVEVKKFYYLLDLYKKQSLLFGKPLQQGTDQADPE